MVIMSKPATCFLIAMAFSLSGCMSSRREASDPKLGNGQDVVDENSLTLSEVMLYEFVSSDDDGPPPPPRGYCSGALLNGTTLLTAGHCVRDREKEKIFVKTQTGEHYIAAV